jgi:hypothetical protein
MAVGSERERELVARAEAGLAMGPIAHADLAPREFYPLVDRECPVLTATPDGWCRGPSDEPWYWRVQLQAQIACMAAEAGALVCGPGWIVGSEADPIWWLVERDDVEIARIRRVAVRAWDDVERLRAARKVTA